MIDKPMDVLHLFPVRKSKKQKAAFRDAVIGYTRRLGYAPTTEKGMLGSKNVIVGDPQNAQYLVTAHYDTCAALPVPNLITPNNLPAFLAYQLFLTAVILAPGILLGWLVGVLTQSFDLGYYTGYLALCLSLFLMLFGPANKHNANDNTSGVVTLLSIAATIPENQRSKVCFVLFDLEEAGLIGSASYARRHRGAAENQIVLNLDCVGDGDEIVLYPTGKLKRNAQKLAVLDKCCGTFGVKSVTVRRKGFAVYPSDQSNFPYGVGICALCKSKLGSYLGKIHTKRDTVLEETNVNILRAALISVITCDAVNQKGNVK